jgi:preprotein translocase subunit SecA
MSAAEIEESAVQKVCSAFLKKITLETEKITESHAALAAPKAPMKLSPQEILKEVVRSILVRNIDKMWQEHLLQIDHLRTEVHLRTVGQKDPLIEFKHEAFSLFAALSRRIEQEIAHALFKFEMVLSRPEPRPPIQPRRPLIDLSLLPEIT